MSRVIPALALGLVFLSIVVASVPARLLGVLVPENTVIMQGFEGTIWRGTASRVLLPTQSGYVHLGAVRWTLSPLSLLLLSPSLTLESSWGQQRLTADVQISGPESIEFKNLDVSFSAQLLRQFLPLAVSGELFAHFTELTLEGARPTLMNGRIVWQQAAWESNQGSLALGSYALDLQQQAGGGLTGTVVTIAGEVVADGTVELDGDTYTLDILVSSKTALNQQLAQALSLIAQPVTGGYRIAFDGLLPQSQ